MLPIMVMSFMQWEIVLQYLGLQKTANDFFFLAIETIKTTFLLLFPHVILLQ